MQEDVRDRPKLTPSDASRFALDLYAIRGAARELPSERDQNFEIESSSGEQYVLKISNAGAPRDILDCQNQAMARVAERCGPGICPTVRETVSGDRIAQLPAADDTQHLVRLVTWVPGIPFADAKAQTPKLLRGVGRMLGQVSSALDGFSHPAAVRNFPWDLAISRDVVRERGTAISDVSRRDIVAHFIAQYEDVVVPTLGRLRRSVIHNDANDFNVIVTEERSSPRTSGLIDFGDMVLSNTVNELAVCLAYVMLDKSDPIAAAAEVVTGYHEVFQLLEEEIEVLFSLACMRLCMSVSMSAYQRRLVPDNEYLSVSEKPAWALLEQLKEIQQPCAHDVFLDACNTEGLASKSHPKDWDGVETRCEQLIVKRTALLGKSLSLSYRSPLVIVRGRGQYLYDEEGREYLDCVNNVCHVGHCHPRVVSAASRQMAQLNTNTRYLHDTIVRYAEKLTATLPDPLSVCFFVNSGSEANDLALRMARAYTGGTEIVTVDGAYHGNLSSLIDISPYKFDGPGGRGAPHFVHKTIMPDGYRGPHKYDESDAGANYADDVRAALGKIDDAERQIAAFICESLLGCGGQIVLPDRFLHEAYQHVRAAGGVCIADEVQVGFGRVGSHFWGFETQGVVPDIVTMGKPIGNGHPLGALVTTPEIAEAFANGMEYFNTYGGNPVSCAVGLAVLETIEIEGLQAHALQVGGELNASLSQLMSKHSVIGDVRGLGMFLGVEFVHDRNTLEPAADIASSVVEHAKQDGILLSTDGPLHNVIKFKPPLPFSGENAERLVAVLDAILTKERS